MANLLPPPSTGVPAVYDPTASPRKTMDFTPIWMKWFVDLVEVLNKSGGTEGSVPGTVEVLTTAPLTGGGPLTDDVTIGMPAVATKVFLAGPVSGANAIPTFRAITATDFPTLGITTTIPLAKLTPAGVNGSITVTNGLITSATNPT